MSFGRWIENKKREIGFSHNALVIIGMLSMLIDHIGYELILNGKLYGYDHSLYENAISLPEASNWLILYRVCRIFGRLAFPIFAFLIVEGYRKTSNLFKYILRILVAALISEIPYDLMVFNQFLTLKSLGVQNVLFTYFIALIMLAFIGLMKALPVGLTVFPAIIAAVACFFLKTDYWLQGILLIYSYYMFRNDLNVKCLLTAIILFISTFENNYGLGVFAVFFIYFYDGQKGFLDLKRIHYIFYPLHMLVLYAIVFISYYNK